MKEKAFTLAEILIVLVIIGVVFAMTIPTLMQRVQNKELKVGLKKNYSILSQAYNSLKYDAGGNFMDSISVCNDGDNVCLKNLFKTKLKAIKDCDAGMGNCMPRLSEIYFMNKSPANGTFHDAGAGLILQDSASLLIRFDRNDCSSNDGGIEPRCGWITLDVNGFKKPNTWGRDIFLFVLNKNKLTPAGPGITYISSDDCNASKNGITCSAKYLIEK